MIDSIKNDIRQIFNTGNMLTKLLVINIIAFVVLILLEAFLLNVGYWQYIFDNIALPGQPGKLLFKPWTILTHMFAHIDFWHILWNMVGLNIFGRIVGDLLGDYRVLPIYLMGGLAGALVFVLYAIITGIDGTAHGASAAVCAFAAVAGITAPDYNIRLLLIGNVKLKYIVLAFLVMDLVGTQGSSNTGGHFAHLGGMAIGAIIAINLQRGRDLTAIFGSFWQKISSIFVEKVEKTPRRSKMKVEYKAPGFSQRNKSKQDGHGEEFEMELNRILDKIKDGGYNKLSKEEKDFLNNASKRNI